MAAPVRRLSREAHRRRIHVRMRKKLRRHVRASAALRAPFEQAHSRAGGGRPDRAHNRFRKFARRRSEVR